MNLTLKMSHLIKSEKMPLQMFKKMQRQVILRSQISPHNGES